MAHCHLSLDTLGILNYAHWLRHGVLASWEHFHDSSVNARAGHDTMLGEQLVLENSTDDVTSCQQISLFKSLSWVVVPKFILVEAWQLDTSWNEHILVCQFSNGFQWSLNTVKNCLQDT